ncbi:hypothetical protein [Legionella sp. WA2022007384]
MQTNKSFNDREYQQKAQLILKNLDNVQSDIEQFNKKLGLLGERLDNANSFPEFFEVVNEIIKAEATLNTFLRKEMKDLNKDVKEIIVRDLKDKSEFRSFTNILNFNQIITDKILKNKERLSMAQLEEQLPKEQYNRAKKFIHSITDLKSMSLLIEKQKSHFKSLLDSADSMKKIHDIEHQIDAQNSDFQQTYQKSMNFPEDEETAGAVIKFLETNEHLKSIMESFDFAESLVDDVLNAKIRVSLPPSPGLK